MKHIFIMSLAMEIGGAERALLGILYNLDYSKYSVDLFLLHHSGELLSCIPKEVNLLPEDSHYSCLATPIVNVIKKGKFNIAFGRWRGKKATEKFEKSQGINSDSLVGLTYSHKYTKKYMPDICSEKEYDLAISFLTPHYFVSEKVRAKKKIAWIHTDYSRYNLDINSELKMWSVYDYIASISDDCSTCFLKVFPSLKNKLIVIKNVIPIKLLQQQSDEFDVGSEYTKYEDAVKILSIGRFDPQKNLSSIPDICKRIREKGINAYWYIIGFGNTIEEKNIFDNITKFGMEKYVHMLGKKSNPYPYISKCDMYIQPSHYEGYCISVIEAQLFNKPVVITNYPTSASQLEDGVDGLIVPLDNEKCANAISELLKSPDKIAELVDNTKHRDYSNSVEVKKIYELI